MSKTPINLPFQGYSSTFFFRPLPVTDSKNRFIEEIVDCGTRYPEAVALRHQDEETVVKSLVSVFSRGVFPEDILSGLWSNFMPFLMN